MSSPFQIVVERIIPGGKGLAFHERRAVFVPYAVAGDRMLVRAVRDRKSYLEVLQADLLEQSPDRRQAPCAYFGSCGGCDFQQMSDNRQLLSKRDILLDALRHVGKMDISPERITLTPSPPLAYRNRLQLKVSQRAGHFSWGFFHAGSHQICEVDSCLIASEELWHALAEIRTILKGWPQLIESLVEVEVFQGDANQYLVDLQIADQCNMRALAEEMRSAPEEKAESRLTLSLSNASGRVHVSGKGHVWKSVGQWRYRVSAGSFFQVNDFLLRDLQEAATEGQRGDKALDLYCGVGFFSLPLAQSFRHVYAVEVNTIAIQDLRETLRSNGVTNCEILAMDLAGFLGHESERLAGLDVVVMDPPRTGLQKHLVRKVALLGARQIVYVSCDPSTLARDLAILLEQGYEIDSLHLLDLFPQTHHLETVAKLQRPAR